MFRSMRLTDVVVVAGCLLILGLVCLQFMVASREVARRETCERRLLDLAKGILNYESQFKMLPGLVDEYGLPHRDQFERNPESLTAVMPYAGRWNGMVSLLPFLDQPKLYQDITVGYTENETAIGPYGKLGDGTWYSPWDSLYRVAYQSPPDVRCPSSPVQSESPNTRLGKCNYAFCVGDSLVGHNIFSMEQRVTRGVFQRGRKIAMSELMSGTSKTMLMAEMAYAQSSRLAKSKNLSRGLPAQGIAVGLDIDTKDPLRGLDMNACRNSIVDGRYKSSIERDRLLPVRGSRWLDSVSCYIGFNTINGPNGANCVPQNNVEGDGIVTASSYHVGGVNVVFADSHTRFIPDTIDIGSTGKELPIDMGTRTPSPTNNEPGNEVASRPTENHELVAPGIWYDEQTHQWLKSDNWRQASNFGVWGEFGIVGEFE